MSFLNETWYQRYRAVLREHAMTPDQVAQQYEQKLVTAARQDTFLRNFVNNFGLNDQEIAKLVVKHMLDRDPSGGKFVQWMAIRYIRGNFRLEDLRRVGAALTGFQQHQRQLQQKDINQYRTLQDLEAVVDPLMQQPPELSGKQQARQVKQDGADKVLETPEVTIVRLKTEEAACFYGKGTKWCTAADHDNMFDFYAAEGTLYVVMTRDGRKYQFHFESEQFMDEKDEQIDLAAFVLKYPATLGWVKSNISAMRSFHRQIKFLMDVYGKGAEEVSIHENTLLNAIRENPPDPHLFNQLVQYVEKYKKNWPEAEELLVEIGDPKSLILYAINARRGRRWRELEPKFLKGDLEPKFLLDYAIINIKGRWPEAEPLIVNDAYSAVEYARKILQKKWPEAEKNIEKSGPYLRGIYDKIFSPNRGERIMYGGPLDMK